MRSKSKWDSWCRHADSRERREGDAGEPAGTMLPRERLPHKERARERHWEVVEWVRTVPGREESTGRWETEMEMEVRKAGCWQ